MNSEWRRNANGQTGVERIAKIRDGEYWNALMCFVRRIQCNRYAYSWIFYSTIYLIPPYPLFSLSSLLPYIIHDHFSLPFRTSHSQHVPTFSPSPLVVLLKASPPPISSSAKSLRLWFETCLPSPLSPLAPTPSTPSPLSISPSCPPWLRFVLVPTPSCRQPPSR